MTAIKRMRVPDLYDLGIPPDYALNGTDWNTGTTNSLISSFTFCRYAYLININRYKRADKIFTTGFGSLFHDLLENTYAYARDNKVFPSVSKIKEWTIAFEEKNMDDMRPDEIKEKELLIAEVLMKYYMRWYKSDLNDYRVISLEEVFDEVFDEFRIRGKIDGHLLKIQGAKHFTFEHKTKGEIVADTIKMILTFDPQNLFYITAKECQHKYKFDGTIYNIIRNPRHKLNKGESLKSFKRKLCLDVEGRPQHFFVRFTQPYTCEVKDIYRVELLAKLREMQNFLDRKILPYKNESACYRRWACEHLQACSTGKLVGYERSEKLFTELEE